MFNSRRSASVGALPAEKKHFVSRVESASGASLDVRCACQYFQCESLLPERVNPVDSRPGSRQGHHTDENCPHLNLHRDDLSTQSFEIVSHADVAAPSVDLSFMERYPELEQTARSRGLVVRSISDATEPELMPTHGGSLMSGNRRRQLSMGGLSSGGSVGRFGDALSMRSGTSLRRISAGNSKTDLYCADINIPSGRPSGQRSASASRRTSNADLFQASIMPPQLNLIAATPLPGTIDQPLQFPSSHQASPAPLQQDFRNARPPLSPDYMRPSDANKENQYSGEVLPQNRPIDVSRFGGDAVRPSFLLETDIKQLQNPYQPTVTPNDPLAETVAELEQIAQEHNIVNIRDNIQTETHRPPSIAGELSAKSLKLDELTKIEIFNDIPVVDIDELVRSEEQKAAEHRSRSPRPAPRRPKSPPAMTTLQLPTSRHASPTPTDPASQLSLGGTSSQPLKRQHTPERQLSPERPNKWAPVSSQQPTISTITGNINLQEASPEVKSSYTSRFKSMFSSKETRQKSPTPQRSRTPSPLMARSSSPFRKEKSPSPVQMLSVFSKSKPQAMSIVTTSAAVIKGKEAEPLAVRVTETFSLKVDDMDQYCARPTKPLAPPPHAQTMYSSREDFAASERTSVDISEAFAPVVVSSVPRGGPSFMAGNRNLYSSEIEMPGAMSWPRSESEFHGSVSKEPSIMSHGSSRPLISVPIQISQGRSTPSEQRFGLQRKSSFREPRTQSHDRSSRLAGGSQDQLYGPARMTKTVSFNFDERKSRLADFESNSPLTQKQIEHRDFLERTYFSRDHEYEPVGGESLTSAAPSPYNGTSPSLQLPIPMDIDGQLSSAATTPRTESRTDYEIHTSQVDSSALEELPLQPENRKKGFMATAQDRTKKMQDGLRQQAGKLRTKLRTAQQSKPKPKPISGSPKAKAKERRRFKAPEFSKIKMPEIKRPDMSKLKELKRPEFTKFNKPDMSKFKLPEKFSTLKLRRSKSFKENETETPTDETATAGGEATGGGQQPSAPKKKFEFNFGTYPRAFRKKKPEPEAVSPVIESSLGTEGLSLSVIPSTETQPSQTSTSSPQGDRGPGPVRSRWADKFSDVSYNDSEGSRYRRYGSELESFDRESSLERRMKEDLEGVEEDTASEAQPQTQMGILGGVADSKQFAEFDEENRAIHEISSQRSREFKRRPMVHQDSDLRSEDSRDAEGWTEKDIQKNKLLRKAELEAEAGYYKYQDRQDAQSTASSGKKVVMEPIDDDEFFLRKRGISEDNIQLRQYISAAIREGYDMPNALQHVGHSEEQVRSEEYGDYDVPPPKPRRLHRNYRPEYEDSQEFQRSEYGDDLSMSQNGSDFLPKRPLRKARSRSKYSVDGSQDIPLADGASSIQYFDDDEEYLRPPTRDEQQHTTESEQALNNLNYSEKGAETALEETDAVAVVQQPRPQAPRRQKRRTRDDASVEKDTDSFINGFGGRSVSNTFLQPQEDVIVYRTEHEYHHVPLATPENFTDGASARTQRSEDDRTSRGADSLILDMHTKVKPEQQNNDNVPRNVDDEKFVIDMLESDGYAVVRKEPLPKPTPPARRKKFTRSPGERFATLPSIRGSRGSPPPARPPPPQQYIPSEDSPLVFRRRSATSLEEIHNTPLLKSNYEAQPQQEVKEEDDYEEPGAYGRPESPRSNLQSGEVINKMKFRPLPPPPRPPREKRSTRGGSGTLDSYEDSERVASSSTADSYDQGEFEVEVSTQTDPLPDDFVCEEFEITEDMKIIEPRRSTGSGNKTLEDLLRSVQAEDHDEVDSSRVLTEDEQLAKGLQRFRDANQRSLSERSRASSQADRSKSLSRPQTPSSAVVIERRVPTPSLTQGEEDATVQASLIVRPISAADLEDEELRREEEELRREGLLSDSSVQSKSDVETAGEEEDHGELGLSDYGASSADLDAAVEQLQHAQLESDYESKLEDDEVERTLRESEYEDDPGEKYSDHYEEDEEETFDKQLTEQELDEALEKQLQEEMEKELAAYRQKEKELALALALADEGHPLSEEEQALSDVEQPLTEGEQNIHSESELEPEPLALQVEEPIIKTIAIEPTEAEVELKFVATLPTEAKYSQEDVDIEEEAVPLPPPRRKSTTTLDTTAPTTGLTIAEQISREVTPVQSLQQSPPESLPSRLAELEVERLRVHALQAGQIQVSQLHGNQIIADDLECKSGGLVVKNIELPPGFIEDIVERVREQRPSLLSSETQTSRQASSEPATSDVEPPTKPPRQSKTTESTSPPNLDEQTQTDTGILPLPPPPAVYPSVEYLQSLAPLAFYNLQRSAEAEQAETTAERKAPHKCRRRHVHEPIDLDSGSDVEEQLVERPRSRSRSRRSRTRSATQPLEEYDDDQPKTVVQAGGQFISACSLELVNIINQLTNYVRGETVEPQQQPRISALMVLFILITFGILVFLLTGRQVHTHHWDYFNPPGNEGRQT
ncbi:uncharacterized protein Dwil_GK16328, isoform E [Drosophila willistoni]|uniref:Uncharacterized protein, isoform E n=1 Tax=Drosophila willistoni TaxID=7260 RepID=A0A0Q9X171_DROWI|nr:uncharacterized protein LOC6643126 isoform X6 [Drosophila willistoni]KRF98530.1 uncharacterized protein Dwil_GK16328, isoform E [Drosophila willistoni]